MTGRIDLYKHILFIHLHLSEHAGIARSVILLQFGSQEGDASSLGVLTECNQIDSHLAKPESQRKGGRMFTYRRLVMVTALLVFAAVVAIPGRVLYCHWTAVAAFEERAFYGTVELRFHEPPFGKSVKQPWYSQLCGTVSSAGYFDKSCTAEDMRQLRNLRGLTHLGLAPTGAVTDEAWQHLPQQLTHLSVQRNLNDAAWQAIARLGRLEHLQLYSSGDVARGFVPAMANLPRLRSLIIYDSLPVATLATLLTQHDMLENLHLEWLGKEGFEQVRRHPNLKWLSVRVGLPDYERLKLLEGLNTLQELHINRPPEYSDWDKQILAKFALTRPDLKVSFHPPDGTLEYLLPLPAELEPFR